MTVAHHRERALVLAAVTGVLERSWPLRDGLSAVDWQWLLSRVREFALPGRFWAELVRAGVADAVPPPVCAELRTRVEDTAAWNGQLMAAALRAGTVLDAAGIPWLPMKGVALACSSPTYGAARHTGDVDLVVAPEVLARAADALGREFPSTKVQTGFDGEPLTPAAADAIDALHVYSFCTQDGVTIELHHGLPLLAEDAGLTRAVMSSAVPSTLLKRRVLVPALDDQLGIVCVHAILVHPGERVFTLRHLADAAELIALGAEPARAMARYDRGGRDAVARTCRELDAARRFATDPRAPECGATRVLEPTAAVERVVGYPHGVAAYVGGLLRKLRHGGWSAIVPSRSFLEERFGGDGRSHLLLALHARRIAAVLGTLFRGGRGR
jgi:hypothetical protein